MLHQYLNALSTQLKQSKKVRTHSQLKAKKWTKSCYDLLSKVIATDLSARMTSEQSLAVGTTISAKTLQKIIVGSYKLNYPIDPRTLNTLDKISIFLGADNWDQFVITEDKKAAKSSKKKDPEKEVLLVVQKALNATFMTYLNSPEFDEEQLGQFFVKDEAAYKKILELISKSQSDNTILSNAYNPSAFEILEIDIKKIENNYAQVATKEYWLLCWWNKETERYTQRFKSIDKHVYILNKIDGVWKVKTDASTFDVIEIKKKSRKKKSSHKLAKVV